MTQLDGGQSLTNKTAEKPGTRRTVWLTSFGEAVGEVESQAVDVDGAVRDILWGAGGRKQEQLLKLLWLNVRFAED